jgi:hypothetical protein
MNLSIFFRSLVAAALLSGLGGGTASAQATPEASTAMADAPVRLDIDLPSKKIEPQGFQSTPLKAAVDFLLAEFRAAGQPVNAICTEASPGDKGGHGAMDAKVPPISLRQVTFEQAIRAITTVAKPAVTLQGDAKLFVIETEVKAAKLRVFNVSDFLLRDGRDRVNDRLKMLRSAITKGISLGQTSNPQLELDDESGLLFATGGPEALEIVAEVARAFCDPPGTLRPASALLYGTPAPRAPSNPAPPPAPSYYGTPVPVRVAPVRQTKP